MWRQSTLFAILQKYDFSSKSQQDRLENISINSCLRYCKSTIFQANHNDYGNQQSYITVVCDTAKVRFFKQITTLSSRINANPTLFAILQKYDFSSKSQRALCQWIRVLCCLRYCKSTIFQANHNTGMTDFRSSSVVCDTAKVRFFKQITTCWLQWYWIVRCLRYCKSTIFQANHNSNCNRVG